MEVAGVPRNNSGAAVGQSHGLMHEPKRPGGAALSKSLPALTCQSN